jgi:fructose-1-phosphate kinase PfkB-like protein
VGHQVSVTGFLGRENTRLFDSLFAQKGIADHFVRIPGETRVNIKIVDDAQGQRTDINYPGQEAGEADVRRLHDAVTALAQECDWFVLSGSVPGADGALFIDPDSAVHALPPRMEVKSTVGAGDAMVAGTVSGLVSGQSLKDCAAMATAFSMGVLSQIGPRLPPLAELQEMCNRVTVRPI